VPKQVRPPAQQAAPRPTPRRHGMHVRPACPLGGPNWGVCASHPHRYPPRPPAWFCVVLCGGVCVEVWWCVCVCVCSSDVCTRECVINVVPAAEKAASFAAATAPRLRCIASQAHEQRRTSGWSRCPVRSRGPRGLASGGFTPPVGRQLRAVGSSRPPWWSLAVVRPSAPQELFPTP